NKFSHHFGQHYRAELDYLEKMEFTDKEKVIEFLRSSQLLGKVLVPTQSTITGLLTDSTIPADVKNELKKFIHKIKQENLTLEPTE
ncbi:MAG: hypothetical protein J5601_01610, partial [Elusimicrobiaceae bacterium]|nr:hypothetical protein [Elusimicrobiaceae bacterium]